MTRKPTSNLPSIDNPAYKKYAKAYKYAMDKTLDELNQAVEGMYHNLKLRATHQ